jgi:hypothetical protein
VIVRKINNFSDYVRIYVKGAPEKVLINCTKTLDDRIQIIDFEKSEAE